MAIRRAATLTTCVIVGLLVPRIGASGDAAPDAAPMGHITRPWRYVSETSAVIYWQLGDIRQAARSYVEYGVAGEAPTATTSTRSPRWSQFHRLRGLQPGTTYSFRRIVIDPRTGESLASEPDTFTTVTLGQAIRIPAEIQGPPYVLDTAGAH